MTVLYGASGTAQLLILSLVVLSLQPPFATVPLVRVVAYNGKMTGLRAPRSLTWACGVIVLNLKLLWDVANGAVAVWRGLPDFLFYLHENRTTVPVRVGGHDPMPRDATRPEKLI